MTEPVTAYVVKSRRPSQRSAREPRRARSASSSSTTRCSCAADRARSCSARPALRGDRHGQGRPRGVDKVVALRPDVVTMDFNMPRLDGAEAVREIMRAGRRRSSCCRRTPSQGARETIEALAPARSTSWPSRPARCRPTSAVADELIGKLAAAAGRPRPQALAPAARTPPTRSARHLAARGPSVASSGCRPAARPRCRAHPGAAGRSVKFWCWCQHMPANFTATLAERLNALSAVTVARRADRRPSRSPAWSDRAGRPSPRVRGAAGALRLTDGPPVNGCRPAADVTMKAAARVFGRAPPAWS